MNFDSVSSQHRQTTYSSDYAGSSPKLRDAKDLPQDVLEALERGCLDEAMLKLQMQAAEKNSFSALLSIQKKMRKILFLPLQLTLQLVRKNRGNGTLELKPISIQKNPTLRKSVQKSKVNFDLKGSKAVPVRAFKLQNLLYPGIKIFKQSGLFIAEKSLNLGDFIRIRFNKLNTFMHLFAEREQKRLLQKLEPFLLLAATQWKTSKLYLEEIAQAMSKWKDKQLESTKNLITTKIVNPVVEIAQPILEGLNRKLREEKERISSVVQKKSQQVAQVATQIWQNINPAVPFGFGYRRIASFSKEAKSFLKKSFGDGFKRAIKSTKEKIKTGLRVAKNIWDLFAGATFRVTLWLMQKLFLFLKKMIYWAWILCLWFSRNSVRIFGAIAKLVRLIKSPF